jgi:Tfp pilus assembly protein PilV
MVKLNYMLKASTLIESLVAMVIMVICLSIGTIIYTNVMSSDKQRMQLKALLLLNKEAIEVKAAKSFLDSEKQVGDWTIKKTIEKYDQSENLYKMSLSVIDRDKKIIFVRNELVPVE